MADSQTTIASLRELNSKLTVEITKLRKNSKKLPDMKVSVPPMPQSKKNIPVIPYDTSSQCTNGSYYIKYQNSPHEKEIKVLDSSDLKKLPELFIKNESDIDTLILLLQQRFKMS
ncbi:19272_t:CDS:2 [Gigaspora margarita]|uniref:19272_t:CDS:1 n=1 Tax=Gigaspora margarita TaxID=4874 RepID=A0ABN7V650_GIGMA|nr:19272_t:CDS:2 [Gigaspora margarita]